MPIYEFRCLECDSNFELLMVNQNEEVEMKCPECDSLNFERILSSTNYSMGSGPGANQGVKSQTKTCSSGSCTTYDIPGPNG
ncbi:MAG: zinc ribbon domain-containing protein [Deltaproteobacteria bacterium]|nr:zinc ribbon domain-containing protein [Deltaproteobacteria bacterium]